MCTHIFLSSGNSSSWKFAGQDECLVARQMRTPCFKMTCWSFGQILYALHGLVPPPVNQGGVYRSCNFIIICKALLNYSEMLQSWEVEAGGVRVPHFVSSNIKLTAEHLLWDRWQFLLSEMKTSSSFSCWKLYWQMSLVQSDISQLAVPCFLFSHSVLLWLSGSGRWKNPSIWNNLGVCTNEELWL